MNVYQLVEEQKKTQQDEKVMNNLESITLGLA